MDHLSESLQLAGEKATFDTYAKCILSNKQVLARILKKTVSEFKDMSFDEIMGCIEGEPQVDKIPIHPGMTNPAVSGMRNEDKVPREGNINYDIRFYVKVPKDTGIIKIIINIEAQKDFYPGYHMESRGVFYCARLISAQLNTEFEEPNYDDLKKVYSIWICFNSSKEQANAIAEYKIHKNDIISGIKDHPDAYDKMSMIMITLNPDTTSEDQFINMLNCLFHEADIEAKKEILKSQYGFAMDEDFGKELAVMCNLSEMLIEKGRTEGESRLQELLKYLLKAGRYVELEKILSGDEQLKQQLYKELGL